MDMYSEEGDKSYIRREGESYILKKLCVSKSFGLITGNDSTYQKSRQL